MSRIVHTMLLAASALAACSDDDAAPASPTGTAASTGSGATSSSSAGGSASTSTTGGGGVGGTGGDDDGWSLRFGDAAAQSVDDVSVDAADHLVVSGSFGGTIDFGGSPLVCASPMGDAFVARLDPSGAHVWSLQLGTTSGFTRIRTALAADGSVVAAGNFGGSFELDGTVFNADAGGDVYAARWSEAGRLSFVRHFECTEDAFASSVAADASGNVLIGGSFGGSCDFGGVVLTAAGTDGFVVKLDPDGGVLWGRAIGGASSDSVFDVRADGAENVIALGQFRDAADFGSGTASTSTGIDDQFLARYDADGAYTSHLVIDWEGTGYLDGAWMEATADGRAVVAGQFATITLERPISGDRQNQIFVGSVDASNELVFGSAYGTLGAEDHVRGLGLRSDGALALTGFAAGPVDFGGAPLSGIAPTFVAVLDAQGAHIESSRIGDAPLVFPEDVALDESGHVIVVGAFAMDADFGFGELSSAGDADGFIVKKPLR